MHAYYQYLIGDCPMPRTLKQSMVFTLFMAIGMGLCMITIVAFITGMTADTYLFMLTHVVPCMILFGACVRLGVFDRPIGMIIGRYLAPHFHGLKLSVAIVLVNVAFMATVMCAMGTAVGCILSAASWEGLTGFMDAYLGILPFIYLSAIPISLLLVGPLAKMAFGKVMNLRMRHLDPARG